MAKAPTPETKTALLPSNGFDNLRATKHRFVKAIETSVPGYQEGTWEDVWQFVFACEETGVERVWGFTSKDLSDIPMARAN